MYIARLQLGKESIWDLLGTCMYFFFLLFIYFMRKNHDAMDTVRKIA
jgi:hypothetical protein